MIFRINTNIASINVQRYLNNNSIGLNRSMERLSSGLRINRSADDAAGLYISEDHRALLAGLQQANRNAGQAATMMQTIESSYGGISEVITRLKELAVQASDGGLSDENRTVIVEEARQILGDEPDLIGEIDRIANSTTFNKMFPIGDPDGDDPPPHNYTFQVGAGGSENDRIPVTVEGARVNDLFADPPITKDDFGDADLASAAIDEIDTALATLSQNRADVGAFMNRLEYTVSNLNAAIENSMASDSVIRDADFAVEMAEMTKAQILIQAGTSMLGQANMMPQNALSLLP